MNSAFENRREAGRELAQHLTGYANRDDVTVLALPRGGVPVAYEVAHALDARLDVLVVRKLGVPFQPELAMGAIASGDAFYLDERIVEYAGVTKDALDHVIARERARAGMPVHVSHQPHVALPERVNGGACATEVVQRRVAEDIVWAKLAALSEGARIASERLF